MLTAIILAIMVGTGVERIESSERVPITIVLMDVLPDASAKAIVIRQGGRSPKDIIMVSQHTATPQTIAAALCVFFLKRPEFQQNPGQSYRFTVISEDVPPEWNAVVIPALAKVIAHLKRSRDSSASESGHSASIEVWVPALVPTTI